METIMIKRKMFIREPTKKELKSETSRFRGFNQIENKIGYTIEFIENVDHMMNGYYYVIKPKNELNSEIVILEYDIEYYQSYFDVEKSEMIKETLNKQIEELIHQLTEIEFMVENYETKH